MFRQIGPMEIFIILGVVLLLFGGRKLPELARGSGRALRIFKSEVQELQSDDDTRDRGRDRDRDLDDLDATADVAEPTTSTSTRDSRPEQA